MYIFIFTYAYKKKVSGSVRRENADEAILHASQSVKRAVTERKEARQLFVASVRNASSALGDQIAVSSGYKNSLYRKCSL